MNYPTVAFALLLAATAAMAAEDPYLAELARLKDGRDKAVTAAVRSIDVKYAQSLQALQQRATRAGSLDAAIAIRTELNTVSTNLNCTVTDKPLSGSGDTPGNNVYGKWEFTPGGYYLIVREDGTIINRDGSVGRWEIDGDKLLLIWPSGRDIMDYPPKHGVLTGVGSKGGQMRVTKAK